MSAASANPAEALRALLPNPPPRDPTVAQVVIPSPLKLSLEQEQNLCAGVREDFHRLSLQLGRKDYASAMWATELAADLAASGEGAVPFFAQRHLAHQLVQGRVEWRKQLVGGLFAHSNVHLPLIGRFVSQQKARAVDAFFGTSPWFTATPVPTGTASPESQKDAEQITAWARHEADESGLEETGREAVSLAFDQGEQVVALFQDAKLDFYQTSKFIAIGADGQPLKANDGDYIFQTDKFVPLPAPIDPTLPADQQPMGQLALKRDAGSANPTLRSQFPPEDFKFELTLIDRVNKRFEGARAMCVRYMDFLCDLNEPNIQDATVCIEVVTQPLMSLIHKLLTDDKWRTELPDPKTRQHIIANLIDTFGSRTGGNTIGSSPDDSHASAAQAPRPELGETRGLNGSSVRSTSQPTITLLKFWKHIDCQNNGLTSSIMGLMTPEGVPLYYDFCANVTHDGLRPYEVVRIHPVPGRWHGIGEPQMFFPLQMAADLLFNRYLWSMSTAGNAVFWNPKLTVEGDANPNLEFNSGTTYTLKNALDNPEKALYVIPVHNIKGDEILKGLEVIMQAATNRSGVANGNDSRMAGMDTAQLATGVNNIERAGQELFGQFLSDLTPPIRRITKRWLGLSLYHINANKVFVYFEGDQPRFVTLTPDQLRDLSLHVTIDLSRYNGQQRLLQAQAVTAVLDRFGAYANNPPLMIAFRPAYVELAKASGMQDAEKQFPSIETLQGLPMPQLTDGGTGGPPQTGNQAPADPNPQLALTTGAGV